MNNNYRKLGLGLVIAGGLFAPISYFVINSVLLTAVGISSIMIGFTSIALANTRPFISPEACQLILKTGMENTAALLEELGLTTKAIYLPSSMREGHAQAVIPLIDTNNHDWVRKKIPGRLIVRYGTNPDDMAISVTTPGSINIDLLENKPGPTSGEIEAAASYILTGVLDIASSVSVNMEDGLLDIQIKGSAFSYEDIWYYRCLGSPIASIVAAISSEALGKPVRIREEAFSKGTSQITLEVLD